MEHDDGIDLGLEFSGDLLEASTAERLCHHLEGILASGASEPDTPVSELGFGDEEIGTILDVWSGRSLPPYPSTSCLHEVFAERAARSPDAVAVDFGDTRLTYADLDSRANQLAHALQARGVGRDSIVAILLERSLEQVVSIFGVLKSGGAYVPLDVAYPDERLNSCSTTPVRPS